MHRDEAQSRLSEFEFVNQSVWTRNDRALALWWLLGHPQAAQFLEQKTQGNPSKKMVTDPNFVSNLGEQFLQKLETDVPSIPGEARPHWLAAGFYSHFGYEHPDWLPPNLYSEYIAQVADAMHTAGIDKIWES